MNDNVGEALFGGCMMFFVYALPLGWIATVVFLLKHEMWLWASVAMIIGISAWLAFRFFVEMLND